MGDRSDTMPNPLSVPDIDDVDTRIETHLSELRRMTVAQSDQPPTPISQSGQSPTPVSESDQSSELTYQRESTESVADPSLRGEDFFMQQPLEDLCDELRSSHDNSQYGKLITVARAFSKRCDPLALFSQIDPNPRTLMYMMLCNNVFLGGSRALSFFLPGMCREESDWDFFCTGTAQHQEDFMKYLEGLTGVEGHCDPKVPYKEGVRVVTYKTGNVTIQFMYTIDVMSMIQVVNNFHSTVVSCYVSGAHAVSLYPVLTRNKVAVARCPPEGPSKSLGTYEAKIRAYEDRGITYVAPSQYFRKCRLPPSRRTGGAGIPFGVVRYAVDDYYNNGPLVIKFDGDVWDGDKTNIVTMRRHMDETLLNSVWHDAAYHHRSYSVEDSPPEKEILFIMSNDVNLESVVVAAKNVDDHPKSGWYKSTLNM